MQTNRTTPIAPHRRNIWSQCFTAIPFLFLLTVLTPAVAGNFLMNPGFELGTGSEAPPWSLWEGTGGAVTNPLVDATNPSARVWFNTGGNRNLAAANNVNLILDTTGTVTYHVKVKYYVPSVAAGTHASAMIRFHADVLSGTSYTVGDPILLDDATPEGNVTPGSWVTKEFDWVNTDTAAYLEYLSFRMYSRNDTGRVNPAPDVYIDDCEFSSSQYRNDLNGVVKDGLGAPLAGATVTLSNSFGLLETRTTGTDGKYAFSTMLPYGAYSVNASKLTYISASAAVTLSASSGTVPALVLTKVAGLPKVSGRVTRGGVGVDGIAVTFTPGSGASASVVTSTLNGVPGSYSLDVVADTYTAQAIQLPLASLPQLIIVTTDMTLDLELTDVLVVGVYADGLTPGALTTWTNKGTLGGRFEVLGTTPPVAGSRGEYKAVSFNSTPMVLTSAGSPLLAPAEIIGTAANYTVSAWLFEPDSVLPDQQTYISWAKRGGPNGSNCEMVYGVNGTWGAAGHWGDPDLPWGTPPSGGTWHNVIVTWDSNTGVEADYIDGVFSKSEIKTLDIGSGVPLPIVLGSGYWYDTTTLVISPDIPFSGYIAQVELFSAPVGADEAARVASLAPPKIPIATIKGKVVTSDGSSPAGFNVTLTDPSGASQGSAVTAADGTYACVVGAPATCKVQVTKVSYVTMPGPQTVSVSAGETKTLGDFTAIASRVKGIVKDNATGKPIYNAVVQSGDGTGPALVTAADGAFDLPAFGCGGALLFADALGYHCKNLFITGTGTVNKQVALVPEAETGVLTNGGFEVVVDGKPTDWGEAWVAGGLTYYASNDAASGTYSAWFTGTASYSALAQYVPVTAGSLYNCYFKAKGDPEVTEWFPMFSFRSAPPADEEIKGWISGESGYEGWVHAPPKSWMQYLRFHTYSGDDIRPFVRVAPPVGAANIAASFTYSLLPPADKGCYVDDVVIDKVAADEPLVTVAPDSTGPVLPIEGFTMPGGVPTFVVPTAVGFQYRLVYVDALTGGQMTWSQVGAWVPGTGSNVTLSDTTAAGRSARFYRLEVQ